MKNIKTNKDVFKRPEIQDLQRDFSLFMTNLGMIVEFSSGTERTLVFQVDYPVYKLFLKTNEGALAGNISVEYREDSFSLSIKHITWHTEESKQHFIHVFQYLLKMCNALGLDLITSYLEEEELRMYGFEHIKDEKWVSYPKFLFTDGLHVFDNSCFLISNQQSFQKRVQLIETIQSICKEFEKNETYERTHFYKQENYYGLLLYFEGLDIKIEFNCVTCDEVILTETTCGYSEKKTNLNPEDIMPQTLELLSEFLDQMKFHALMKGQYRYTHAFLTKSNIASVNFVAQSLIELTSSKMTSREVEVKIRNEDKVHSISNKVGSVKVVCFPLWDWYFVFSFTEEKVVDNYLLNNKEEALSTFKTICKELEREKHEGIVRKESLRYTNAIQQIDKYQL